MPDAGADVDDAAEGAPAGLDEAAEAAPPSDDRDALDPPAPENEPETADEPDASRTGVSPAADDDPWAPGVPAPEAAGRQAGTFCPGDGLPG